MTNKKRDNIASAVMMTTSSIIALGGLSFMYFDNPYIKMLIIYCMILPFIVVLPIFIYFRIRVRYYWQDGIEYRRPGHGIRIGTTSDDEEEKIAKILQYSGGKTSYLINNITLPFSKGGEYQIDHVLLSEAGVFVVEVDKTKGKITGDLESKTWTLHKGGKEIEISNPTDENYIRCQCVREVIGEVKTPMFSCIVYPNANTNSMRSVNIFNKRWLKKLVVHHYIRHHVTQTQLVVMADRLIRKKREAEEEKNKQGE